MYLQVPPRAHVVSRILMNVRKRLCVCVCVFVCSYDIVRVCDCPHVCLMCLSAFPSTNNETPPNILQVFRKLLQGILNG